ncbi:hypothetical protein [Qipengyuania thermophila]|uniref:hypothetical protein n=1 Tax=Qipengyuania thermophila TaxID=2509361 RepID=UPI0018F89D00|nr:hypothetical protein [Qipengyuania thermophila]
MRLILLLVAALFVTGPAHARWHEAQSQHFVIYANDRPQDVQAFAEMLEKYHAALQYLSGRPAAPVSPSNRVVIFAVGSERHMERMADGNPFVAGFYIPRAGGSRAYVQNIALRRDRVDFSVKVLLHEYAHHFLMAQSRFDMPRWMSEGAAEFYASALFPDSGHVSLGRPAAHRAQEILEAPNIPIRHLIDDGRSGTKPRNLMIGFYGQSWLMYHYLMFAPERQGQLDAYARHLMAGTPSVKAAEAAFGDLDALDKELTRYARAPRMMSVNLSPERLGPIPAVRVSPLAEGHAAAMPLIMRSQRGVSKREAPGLAASLRRIAERYPQDAQVFAALAEAEFDAGNDAAAIAAADKAIALDPSIANAYVQKGYALFRQARDAGDKDAAYAAAMAPFTQLNRLENDHPLPLIYYHRSFSERGAPLTERARHALERAGELAPFDRSLWLDIGLMQAEEGKRDMAVASLASVAYSPHPDLSSKQAQAIIDAINAAGDGALPDLRALMTSVAQAEKDEKASDDRARSAHRRARHPN